jgi:hypothetical protein
LPLKAASCDTTHISYSTCIQPLLKAYCIRCHAKGNTSGGLALDDYATVKLVAQSADLWGCVEHQDGYPSMPPQKQKIDTAALYILRKWMEAGEPK